jgi:hypothetical protein
MVSRIFLAGASGAIGSRLTPLLLGAGHYVCGSTRSAVKAEALRALGVEPVLVDVFDAARWRAPSGASGCRDPSVDRPPEDLDPARWCGDRAYRPHSGDAQPRQGRPCAVRAGWWRRASPGPRAGADLIRRRTRSIPGPRA